MLDLSRISILVVDDNDHMRNILRLLLNGLGVSDVRLAHEGATAMQMIRTMVPDVVFTDWVMSPLDGLDLANWIRQSPECPNRFLPVVMISAYGDRERVTRARDAGINEFLVKPISARAVYSRLRELVERPRPYVQNKSYFGPDRRRRSKFHYTGPERRSVGPQVRRGRPGEDPLSAYLSSMPATEASLDMGAELDALYGGTAAASGRR